MCHDDHRHRDHAPANRGTTPASLYPCIPHTFVNDMRFWNFVVSCIALPVSSTVYAAGSGTLQPSPQGKPRPGGHGPGQEHSASQPGTARHAKAALRVVN